MLGTCWMLFALLNVASTCGTSVEGLRLRSEFVKTKTYPTSPQRALSRPHFTLLARHGYRMKANSTCSTLVTADWVGKALATRYISRNLGDFAINGSRLTREMRGSGGRFDDNYTPGRSHHANNMEFIMSKTPKNIVWA